MLSPTNSHKIWSKIKQFINAELVFPPIEIFEVQPLVYPPIEIPGGTRTSLNSLGASHTKPPPLTIKPI